VEPVRFELEQEFERAVALFIYLPPLPEGEALPLRVLAQRGDTGGEG